MTIAMTKTMPANRTPGSTAGCSSFRPSRSMSPRRATAFSAFSAIGRPHGRRPGIRPRPEPGRHDPATATIDPDAFARQGHARDEDAKAVDPEDRQGERERDRDRPGAISQRSPRDDAD